MASLRVHQLAVIVAVVTISMLICGPGVGQEGEQESAPKPQRIETVDLHFEVSENPVQWGTGQAGYEVALDTTEHQAGLQSLRITCHERGKFGMAVTNRPADEAWGKRLILSGYIKTSEVADGYAGLWLRADAVSGPIAIDNMGDRGVTGSTDWTRHEVALDIEDEATQVVFGGLLTGSGTAWFDTLELKVVEQAPPPPPITVKGVVVDAEAMPVPGALVALVDRFGRSDTPRVRADAEGHFEIVVEPGAYAMTATAAGHTVAYQPPVQLDAKTAAELQTLTMGGEGHTITGRLTADGTPVANHIIELARIGQLLGDVFSTETDEQGRYTVKLMPATYAVLLVDEQLLLAQTTTILCDADKTVDLTTTVRKPAPAAVVEWIKGQAIPLSTPVAGHGFEDMQPLRELIGSARVVGLGEATHGTREFFQLKHRMFEFLVEEMGFTVFAIEANWPEALAINDYVLEGKGDAKRALAGIYFWTWNTEEVLNLIEWMRGYNADPEHKQKLRFYGFDMQTTRFAADQVTFYLQQVDPDHAAAVVAQLKPFVARGGLQALTADESASLATAVDALVQRFDAQREAFIKASSERAWVVARQEVVLLRQAYRTHTGDDGFNERDRSMAANIEWILATEPPGTRIMVWAHNRHISTSVRDSTTPMGVHLRKALGKDYLNLGFSFNQGAFQAIGGRIMRLREFSVGPAAAGNIGATCARSGLPIFVLDLRKLPEQGPVSEWFRAPRPMRQIGSMFAREREMIGPIILSEAFDGLIFVDTTTRARPIAR